MSSIYDSLPVITLYISWCCNKVTPMHCSLHYFIAYILYIHTISIFYCIQISPLEFSTCPDASASCSTNALSLYIPQHKCSIFFSFRQTHTTDKISLQVSTWVCVQELRHTNALRHTNTALRVTQAIV